MNTTEITVNAECPGCGKDCPPKLGIPSAHQYGWQWDARTEQRWCRRCHVDLRAKRHFEARGWVWKVAHHELDGDHVRYVDEVTDHIDANEMWGRATVTVVCDPERVVLPPEDAEEFRDRIEKMVADLEDAGVTLPIMSVGGDTATALREALNT